MRKIILNLKEDQNYSKEELFNLVKKEYNILISEYNLSIYQYIIDKTFDNFIWINGALALFYMIPVSQLDGAKVFFSSRVMYIFGLLFIIGMVSLVYYISVIPLLIICGVFGLVGASVYFYYSFYRGKVF